uniref:Zinc finger MYM-type protein 1 n=1 Tax=Neogobius melanostomus TaxID=47308 RepID=A0A8C6T8V9_9GOBI
MLFREHEGSAGHKNSVMMWKDYKTSKLHGDVIDQMNIASVDQISERREYLRCIVAVTKFLGRQGLAFRGHDEKQSSDNQGNFIEMMSLLKEFDPFLQNYHPPAHSTYLSASSQNEWIESCAASITSRIVQEMKDAGMYSLMADEARDGLKEQLAVCVRSDKVVKERFITLVNLTAFDAKAITTALQNVLDTLGLNNLRCVAQAYDGASVISGNINGVQARFREKHPEALYVHCYAHELNLVLCHTCRAIPEATDLFNTLESVYSFFSCSLLHHEVFVNMQKALGLEHGELVQLSKTRWACQLHAVKAVLANLPALLRCFADIGTAHAVGLLSKLSSFSGCYILVMFKVILSTTEGLHKYLQKSDVDLAQATLYKDADLETLQEMRRDESAGNIYKEALIISENNNLNDNVVVRRRKQRRLDDFVSESSSGARTHMSTEDELRQNVFFPCLDRMTEELMRRFSGVGAELMKGLLACHPASSEFLDEDSLLFFARHYKISVPKEEIAVAKRFLTRRIAESGAGLSNIDSIYKLIDSDMFPGLSGVFQTALTIPVSSCTCERSFSALRRLHTWLRRTMGQERLTHLALMSIERHALYNSDHNQIIDQFAQLKPRRYTLVVPPSQK